MTRSFFNKRRVSSLPDVPINTGVINLSACIQFYRSNIYDAKLDMQMNLIICLTLTLDYR